MFNFAPILIGAAVGAGTSALFGGDPLRGGLLGGVSGGLFGGGLFDDLLKRTAAGGAASGLNTVGTAAGAANTAQTAQGLVNQAVASGTPVQAFTGTPGGMSPMTAALQQAAMRDPTGFASGITSLPASAAVPFGGSTGATTVMPKSFLSGLSEYMPSPQVLGGLGLQAAMQRPPMPTVQAPAGGITQGRAPDIIAVQNLVSSMRRKPPEGILGNYFG